MTPEFINQWIFPAAFSLLPPDYDTPAARRLMIAIGLQESRFKARRQMGQGPARSFWQFERIGVEGLLVKVDKAKTASRLADIATFLGCRPVVDDIHAAIEHNDILSAVCARLLLFTHADPIPTTQDAAWAYYLKLWRPGKAKPDTWAEHWQTASELIP
jgi:hypothetical protein